MFLVIFNQTESAYLGKYIFHAHFLSYPQILEKYIKYSNCKSNHEQRYYWTLVGGMPSNFLTKKYYYIYKY